MAVFDQYASQYDEWYSEKKGKFVDEVETKLLFQMIEIKEGMKILDVGCGTGNFSMKLAEMGCRVTGIDISEEMLSIARKKVAEKGLDIKFINMDINDLKFEENEFDAAVSMAAFEFIEDGRTALESLQKIVKKDGLVAIGTISSDSEWGQLYQSREVAENSVFKYAKFKTLEEMKSWDAENLADYGECLFVSPLSDEGEFVWEIERELEGIKKGGYICAVWKLNNKTEKGELI